MSENHLNNSEKNKDSNVVGSSLLEFLYVVVKSRKFLISFVLIVVAGAVILALLLPKEYKATASVLPAEQSDMLSSLSGLSSLAKNFSPFKGLSSIAGTDEVDKYIAILKSTTVQNQVIKKYNLKKVYDLEGEPHWKVAKRFSENVDFNIEDEGNLVIDVYDESPQLAAKIANYMVKLLNQLNTELHVTNAKASRQFIEKRYFQNLQDINDLEDQMQEFQEKYGVIAVPEQIEATIKTVAELYADITKEEVEFSVLKQSLSPENPMLKIKEIEMKELRHEFDKIINSPDPLTNESKVLIPLNTAPDLAGKYLNIFKNLEIQYKIAEFITPIYEQAKIEEARNTPSVLVLDQAFPPERKARPKISLFALIGLVSSLVIGLFIVFTFELFSKFKTINPEKYNYISRAFHPITRSVSNKS